VVKAELCVPDRVAPRVVKGVVLLLGVALPQEAGVAVVLLLALPQGVGVVEA
jgi:hypothetical protein